MTDPTQRKILILAGPNGAGKTTFAQEFLVGDAQCPTFVNADIIAKELSAEAPERVAMRAGRLMLSTIRNCVARGDSFAFETTLADRSYARWVPNWRAAGYHVSLWFLSLPSAEASIVRVTERVAHGGHFVPHAVVRRRFAAGKANFENLYKALVDAWVLYDNSGDQPVLLDWGERR